MLLNLAQLVFTAILFIAVLIGVVLDAFGYAEGIEKHIPWLARAMKNRIVICMLMIFATSFLVKDFRDAVAIAPAPQMLIKAPLPPSVEIQNITETLSPSLAPDIQLEIDAYRLAEQIETWWTHWDDMRNPIPTIPLNPLREISDWQRWSNPPSSWNPGQQGREYSWREMLTAQYSANYQNKVDNIEGRFKQRGIEDVPDIRVENANGPVGIRATIRYLRQSANALATKPPSQPPVNFRK